MAPLRRVRGKYSTTNKLSRFSASTFNVILRRYSLLEVPWRRIHNVIANAMSICVAFSNKVMDTRLPLPVGSGDKYDVDSNVQCGRSMIEMLGVLAIIAVLSVGGIAGYSKAMEQFKINKALDEYSSIIVSLLENAESIHGMHNYTQIGLVNFLEASNSIPPNYQKMNSKQIKDPYGNMLQVFLARAYPLIVLDIYLGGINTAENGDVSSPNFSNKMCLELFQKLFIPLHNSIQYAEVYRYKGASYRFSGDKACGDTRYKCLVGVTIDEIHKACSSCSGTNEACDINIQF